MITRLGCWENTRKACKSRADRKCCLNGPQKLRENVKLTYRSQPFVPFLDEPVAAVQLCHPNDRDSKLPVDHSIVCPVKININILFLENDFTCGRRS